MDGLIADGIRHHCAPPGSLVQQRQHLRWTRLTILRCVGAPQLEQDAPETNTLSAIGPNHLLALSALCSRTELHTLTVMVGEGELVASLGTDHWATAAGQLHAWPCRSHGLLSLYLHDRTTDTLEFATAWPFARSGPLHEMSIDLIEPEVNALFLNTVCGLVAGRQLALFDGQCAAAQGTIHEGQTVGVRIMGWAIELSPEPGLGPVEVAELFLPPRSAISSPEATGASKPFLERALGLVCDLKFGPPVYGIEGRVRSVRETVDLFGCEILRLDVATAQPGCATDSLNMQTMGSDPNVFIVEVWVPVHRWSGPLPHVGDRVSGQVWLQGTFVPQGDTGNS